MCSARRLEEVLLEVEQFFGHQRKEEDDLSDYDSQHLNFIGVDMIMSKVCIHIMLCFLVHIK